MSSQENWDLEEFIQHAQGADNYLEEMKLRVKRTHFPDDPIAWLTDLSALLDKVAEEPPTIDCSDLLNLMRLQIVQSQRAIMRQDIEDLQLTVLTLSENLKILKNRLRSARDAARKLGNSLGGKASKKRFWAIEAAARILKENPATESEAWKALPMSANPWEFEVEGAPFEVYVDGDQLIGVDCDFAKDSSIKKSTFFKEYYRPQKKRGKQVT